MKVCHFSCGHSSDDPRVFHKECTSLAHKGYDVSLIIPGESREENGVHVIGIGDIPDSRIKRMTQMARKAYNTALELNADVYHFHDPELLPYGAKLAKKGYKVIWDSHEDYTDMLLHKEYIPRHLRKLANNIFLKYYFSVLKLFEAVIIVTPSQATFIKQKCRRLVMITNYPIVDSDFNIYRECNEARYKANTLVFAGALTPNYCHYEIITALEKCDNVKYILCGPYNDSVDYFHSLQGLEGWKSVDYKGRIPHEKVIELLRSSSVGIATALPSRQAESIGSLGIIKLYEEMAMGLPVICTDLKLWKEMIDKYHCGICVDPTDSESIYKAIYFLTKNPDEAMKMGINARKAVEKEYNWKTQEEKLLSLYSELENNEGAL